MEKIKELREKTGAGMVDCKKALDECNGDIDKALEYLRKKGIAKAAKREGKETSEGIIKLALSDDKKSAYILEINTETDFVARNDKFQEFAENVLNLIKEKNPKNLDDLLILKMGENGSVKETLDYLSGVIGEKIVIKNFFVLNSAGTIGAYSHMGGRIGVLVSLSKEGEDELAENIAMQIAAINPKYLKPEDVPSEETDKEKEIYKEQLLKEGKPENIIDKILEGKIRKYYEDVCLLEQEFIKDDKKKVKDVLGDVKIKKFIRFSLQ